MLTQIILFCISIVIVATAWVLLYACLVALDASKRSVVHLRQLVMQAIEAVAHKQD